MKYTKLGNSDIDVSKVCVGCMSFGQKGTMHNWTLDSNETEGVVKYAIDLRINFLIPQTVIQKGRVKNI